MLPRRCHPLGGTLTAVTRSLTGRLRTTDRVAEFEAALRQRLGCRHVLAVASGRDALLLALDALGLAPGDQLIIPAYTLGELLPLLHDRGLELVPADVDPATFNVTPETVAARIGARTRALLVVHLFGAPCDLAGLRAVAERHRLPLIEDAAHALGARLGDGRPAGTGGRVGCFSLEPGKPLGTFGGGLLVTDDDALAQAARERRASLPRREGRALRRVATTCAEELGVRSPLYGPLARLLFAPRLAGAFERHYRGAHARARQPAAYSRLQADLGLARLPGLEERNARLEALAAQVAAGLPPGFTAQRRDRHGTPAFYQLVARYRGDPAALRQAALRHGLDLGIGSEVMDDTAALLEVTDCPHAAAVAAEAVLLPVHAGLDHHQVPRLLERLARAAGEVERGR